MHVPVELNNLFDAVHSNYLAAEPECVQACLKQLNSEYPAQAIYNRAEQLLLAARGNNDQQSLVDSFLQEYQLDSKEGVLLMSIAEALLRIPDQHTQDLFLQEKLTSANWQQHLLNSDSLLVNLSTSALYVTSQLEVPLTNPDPETTWFPIYQQLLSRLGVPLIRTALKQAMQQLAYQFVIAESIEDAVQRGTELPVYCYSFDMLGEAALTANDAQCYFDAYSNAIDVLAQQADSSEGDLFTQANLSIKLSALSPRYEPLQQQRVIKEISQRLLLLAKQARKAGIFLTLDAEEAYRLQLSLKIFQTVFCAAELDGWSGFGLALQAYQKSAMAVIEWLAALARQQQRCIPLRLVKGAYWDTEIKYAQQHGLADYPVFTSKSATDVSYLACTQLIFKQGEVFYPQFASHNALTLAAIAELAKQHGVDQHFEFQRLYGMGEQVYAEIVENPDWQIPCRIYAPVGCYQELLPYLVRRMLENGANNSFVNQFKQTEISVQVLLDDPVIEINNRPSNTGQIPLPSELYAERKNSAGLNLGDLSVLQSLKKQLQDFSEQQWFAAPIINSESCSGEQRLVANPADQRSSPGTVIYTETEQIKQAIESATSAFQQWRLCTVEQRAACLLKAADLIEIKRLEFVSLCISEGGRTVSDALSEVREAVDFCRYYAQTAILPGPTGEENCLSYQGRGVFVCISPWNFPIAIFIGQITAALVAGNTVITKPASQTVLTAMRCIQILHEAGIPTDVLQFIPASGTNIMQHCLSDLRIAGVAFTGSSSTAQAINQQLANNEIIVPLIAETGGQNVMIADNSALLQQVVIDAIHSAFNSAGQRCSALRVLFLQDEIADQVIELLIGAMHELVIGNPQQLNTDIGPVINQQAVDTLNQHRQRMQEEAHIVYQCKLDSEHQHGSFFAPCLVELTELSQLTEEIFGPVLHIIRYKTGQLEQVINSINASRYGLTLGIHSRIEKTINTIQRTVCVGNIYVNRNMIGAVVGSQPFGGMGLSGTGPKAGGPNYLKRFAVEQAVSINTVAIGGNAALLNKQQGKSKSGSF